MASLSADASLEVISNGVCDHTKLKPEQAAEQAKNFADQLDLPVAGASVKVSACKITGTDKQYYSVRFYRAYNNIHVCSDNLDMINAQRTILGPSIRVDVAEEGIITLDATIYQQDLLEAADNKIITVKAAISALKKNASKLALYYLQGVIKDIELNYVTVPIRDNHAQYHLIPAWVFYDEGYTSRIWINALDGTLIQ